MKKLVFAFFSCAALLFSDITVAAAASYKNALTEVVEAYKGGKVETVFAASGKLTQQIGEGAEFDVFMSADLKYPQEIVKNGWASGDVIATVENKLILWSRSIDLKKGLDVLTDKSVKQIAIANPKTAPLGAAAAQALEKAGLYKKIESKIVQGDNISQATTFVESGAAEVGITGYSVVADIIAKGEGKYEYIDSKLYDPLLYGTVIIKSSKKQEEAQKFVAFLKSDAAIKIFDKHGLSVIK
ncbi:MAG: molybdate ABC transporter substrate-binding protein [Helicobacteraceae bacterium]|jgi:molybdate transport system substrate-binding protein|nr:molybdate ABC transporter substrate-binding protein [Helicobacteraceae bacterium]